MSLFKGFNNTVELHFADKSSSKIYELSKLYMGNKLIWQKAYGELQTNLLSSDNYALISEDGLILMSKDNG